MRTELSRDERLVFYDLETGGLFDVVAGNVKITKPLIQIAAIAVDRNYRECETFEVKVAFDECDADRFALNLNHYSQKLWEEEALPPLKAARSFASFLRRHATVDRISKAGKPYQLAQLVAHNAERFDGPLIHAWYRDLEQFLPAALSVLCTKQRAYWHFREQKHLTPPEDYKLITLCKHLDIPLAPEQAHDALNDVRATVKLYRAMLHSRLQERQQAAA